MPYFSLKKTLPSCFIDIDLIKRLENYLNVNVKELLSSNVENITSSNSITVTDNFGDEKFKSVNEFQNPMYYDGTRSVKLNVEHIINRETIDVSINFDRNRMFTEIKMSCKLKNAREMSIAVLSGVLNVLKPNRTLNWFFRPPEWVGFAIFILSGLIVMFAFLSLKIKYIPAMYASWSLVLMVLFYYASAKYFKQYSVFDTRNSRLLLKSWNWVVLGILSFIIFGSFFVFLRGKFVGF